MPTLNAVLNATSATLLVLGHAKIKRGDREGHRRLMIAAFTVSGIFLISYITYHAIHGTTRFALEGWIRPVYFTILTSHTILAVFTLPLAIIALRRGLRDDREAHRRIAKWTYPVWLYVSVTGVIVYFMLYHL
jgi:uncharacterized membrane protein YozB (DUF420 family)